jgi:hypothetical protein
MSAAGDGGEEEQEVWKMLAMDQASTFSQPATLEINGGIADKQADFNCHTFRVYWR